MKKDLKQVLTTSQDWWPADYGNYGPFFIRMVPKVDHPLIDEEDAAALKAKILASGLTVPQMVRTAWASASSFRGTDARGGANGARVRLAPQKDWAANTPKELATVLQKLEAIQKAFSKSGKKVSLADVIVLAGNAAIEQAAKSAGLDVQVPFTPGRTDASQAQTDVNSFASLETAADGFRNYAAAGQKRSPAELLIDKANLLTLTVPEMTALVGGLRALNANTGGVAHGVFTDKPGTLTNDYFVNLLDMSTKWSKSDGREKLVRDFVKAWTRVMNLDRFDVVLR